MIFARSEVEMTLLFIWTSLVFLGGLTFANWNHLVSVLGYIKAGMNFGGIIRSDFFIFTVTWALKVKVKVIFQNKI